MSGGDSVVTPGDQVARPQPEANCAAKPSEETAKVWRVGRQRYLTKRAALRGAAKQYLRQMFRSTGDDPSEVPPDQWHGWIEKLAGQLKRGEEMTFAEEWFEDPYGDPRTPSYGVGP